MTNRVTLKFQASFKLQSFRTVLDWIDNDTLENKQRVLHDDNCDMTWGIMYVKTISSMFYRQQSQGERSRKPIMNACMNSRGIQHQARGSRYRVMNNKELQQPSYWLFRGNVYPAPSHVVKLGFVYALICLVKPL